MKKKPYLQFFAVFLLGMVGIAGGLFLFLRLNQGLEPALLTSQIGVNGPIRISLPVQIDPSLLASSMTFSPEISTRVDWDGQNMVIWPEQTLEVGDTIEISLDMRQIAGAESPFSRSTYTWNVIVREPQVVYLNEPINNPDIYISSLDGEAQLVISSAGQVIDFSASSSGEEIVYSEPNNSGGSNIWMWFRSGNSNQIVYACQENECINPVVSPDGNTVVFVRSERAANAILWQVDTHSGEAGVIASVSTSIAAQPQWSPNGQYVSFYNTREGAIQVVDMTTNDVFTLPASQTGSGSWLPDGEGIAFSAQVIAEGMVYTQVYVADLTSGTVEAILGENPQTMEYGVPAWSPDGEWLVISLRVMLQSGNNQLWIMRPDGSQAQAIADDPMNYYGSYSWSPDGSAIVYQQFNTTSSDSTPQVMVWDRESGESRVLASNAALPQWIP